MGIYLGNTNIGGGGGGSLTTDQENRLLNANKFLGVNITTDRALAAGDVEIPSGTDIGKKPILYVDGSQSFDLTLNDLFLTDDTIILESRSNTSTLEIIPGTGAFVGLSGSNNSVRLTGGYKRIVIQKVATGQYRVDGDFTEFEFTTAYSPNNLYTEASAANADNYANTIGTWDQFQSSPGDITAVADNAGNSSGSIQFLDSNPNNFSQIFYDYTGQFTLTQGSQYFVRFRYKFLQGPELSLLVTDIDTALSPFQDRFVISTSASPSFPWTQYTSPTFTADVAGDEIIRIYGGFNQIAGAEEFRITDFEVVPV